MLTPIDTFTLTDLVLVDGSDLTNETWFAHLPRDVDPLAALFMHFREYLRPERVLAVRNCVHGVQVTNLRTIHYSGGWVLIGDAQFLMESDYLDALGRHEHGDRLFRPNFVTDVEAPLPILYDLTLLGERYGA